MVTQAPKIGRKVCRAASFAVALCCNASITYAESFPVGLDYQGSWKVDCKSKVENGFDFVFIQDGAFVKVSDLRCELASRNNVVFAPKDLAACGAKGLPKKLIGSFDLQDGHISISSLGTKTRYTQCEGHYAPR